MSIFFALREERLSVKIILAVILSLFLGAGIISIFHYGDTFLLGNLTNFNNDDVKYIRSAWTLLDKGILTYKYVDQPTVFIMPGITFILAFFMLLFGKVSGVVAFKLFQVVLQTCCLYLIFLIGRKVFNSITALVACALSLTYVVNSATANLVLTETCFTFLLLLLIYLSLCAVEQKSLKLYIAGAIVWVGAIYFRPTIGLYPLLILFLWIKRRYTWREMLKYTSVVLGLFLLLMSPWWIRNYTTFHRFIPLTLSSGNPFLQGTYINSNQKVDYIPYQPQPTEIANNEAEMQTGWKRLETYVPQKPLSYLYWYTIGKSIKFWKGPFYWKNIFDVPYRIMLIMHQSILALGLIGLAASFITNKKRKSKKENRDYPAFLFLVIIYFNVIYLPYYTFPRYAYPVMGLVILFASYGISAAAEKVWHFANSRLKSRAKKASVKIGVSSPESESAPRQGN